MFFGEMKWSWEEVVTRKQAFMDMLVGATSRSEPVFLKVGTTSTDTGGKPVKLHRTETVKESNDEISDSVSFVLTFETALHACLF